MSATRTCMLLGAACGFLFLTGCSALRFESNAAPAPKRAEAPRTPAARTTTAPPPNIRYTEDVWLGGSPISLAAVALVKDSDSLPGPTSTATDVLPLHVVGPINFRYASAMDVLGVLLADTGISLVVGAEASNEELQKPQRVEVFNLTGPLHQVMTTIAAQMNFGFRYTAQTKVLVVSAAKASPRTDTRDEPSGRPAATVGEDREGDSAIAERAVVAASLLNGENLK